MPNEEIVSKVYLKGKRWCRIGYFLIIVSMYMGLHILIGERSYKTETIIIFIIAIVMIVQGVKKRKLIKRFREYADIIYRDEGITVDDLAKYCGNSYNFVMKDLKYMIENRFFGGISINEKTNEIKVPRKKTHYYDPKPEKVENFEEEGTTIKTNKHDNEIYKKKEETGPKVIICKGCGAKNVIEHGKISQCEYCGSPLSN